MSPELSDEDLQKLERNSFILLQHVYTASQAIPQVPLHGLRAGEALGFSESDTRPLLEHLRRAGFLDVRAEGHLVSLTRAGAEYIEKLAWRRRTVRAHWLRSV